MKGMATTMMTMTNRILGVAPSQIHLAVVRPVSVSRKRGVIGKRSSAQPIVIPGRQRSFIISLCRRGVYER